jgi:hypothetical protein
LRHTFGDRRRMLIGFADNDDQKDPTSQATLRRAIDEHDAQISFARSGSP